MGYRKNRGSGNRFKAFRESDRDRFMKRSTAFRKGEILLQWFGIKKRMAERDRKKAQKAVEEGHTSRAGKIATKAVVKQTKQLIACVEDQIRFGKIRKFRKSI